MKNTTKAIYLVGIIIFVFSIARWSFYYEDLFRLLLGVAIGIIIGREAYVHGWMVMKDMKIDSLDARFDSLVISLKDRDVIKSGDLRVG